MESSSSPSLPLLLLSSLLLLFLLLSTLVAFSAAPSPPPLRCCCCRDEECCLLLLVSKSSSLPVPPKSRKIVDSLSNTALLSVTVISSAVDPPPSPSRLRLRALLKFTISECALMKEKFRSSPLSFGLLLIVVVINKFVDDK